MLSQKVAMVTGAGSGIGKAIAIRLAEEGANLVIVDIDLLSAEKVCKKIESLGRRAKAVKANIASWKEVDQVVYEALNLFKEIDVLVNNAGVDLKMAIEDVTEDIWDRVININLKGTFVCSQVIGKQMIKQGHGKIVNVASTLAHVSYPMTAVYSASKGGVLQLTKAFAVEWAKYNINVNSVSPGATKTSVVEDIIKSDPNFLRDRVNRIPQRRMNEPLDVANVVLFLASSDSNNITGEDILVDGGICALHSGYVEPKIS